jgi:hypothetical protein
MNIKAIASTLLLSAAIGSHGNAVALPAAQYITCNVQSVAVLDNRVHVDCGYGSWIRFFAAPTSSSSEAARLLSMGQMAVATSKPLYFMYDANDNSAASYGCDYANCRRPITIQLNR